MDFVARTIKGLLIEDGIVGSREAVRHHLSISRSFSSDGLDRLMTRFCSAYTVPVYLNHVIYLFYREITKSEKWGRPGDGEEQNPLKEAPHGIGAPI